MNSCDTLYNWTLFNYFLHIFAQKTKGELEDSGMNNTYDVNLNILSSRKARSTEIPNEPPLTSAQMTSKAEPTMTMQSKRLNWMSENFLLSNPEKASTPKLYLRSEVRARTHGKQFEQNFHNKNS